MTAPAMPLEILCEDGPVLAVNKPAGLVVQGAGPDDPLSLAGLVRDYLRQKYAKPGNVYLGILHRLDRPVSGAVVFARNSKAAARLSEQFRTRQVEKLYWAVVEQFDGSAQDRLTDWLVKESDQTRAQIVPPQTAGARPCALSYRRLAQADRRGPALLAIRLETGRRHQIRAQLAHRGWPVLGDIRYGARTRLPRAAAAIALHAHQITFSHPIRHEPLTIAAPVPPAWQALLRGLGYGGPS